MSESPAEYIEQLKRQARMLRVGLVQAHHEKSVLLAEIARLRNRTRHFFDLSDCRPGIEDVD